jgi:hypothetical protein
MAERYSPGTPLLAQGAPLRNASTLNSILETAENFQQQKRLGGGGSRIPTALGPDFAKVTNSTGQVLRRGDVVELYSPPAATAYWGFPWFTGKMPDETLPFGVMQEPMPNDPTVNGLIQVAGVCVAYVNIQTVGDGWAYREYNAKVFKSDPFFGDVRIIQNPSGSTGEQLCWIQFEKSPDTWLGKIYSTINKGSSGTVGIWWGDPGSEVYTGRDIPACYNRTKTLTDTTKWVVVNRIHRRKYVSPWEC